MNPQPALNRAKVNRPKARLATRRQTLRALAWGVALPSLIGTAHAGFNFFTSEYTATRAELERELGKQFPQQRGYGGLVTVILREPQLGLDHAANRVRLGMALTLASPLMQPSEMPGTITLSSALRYDAATLSLRLEQPRAEQLTVGRKTYEVGDITVLADGLKVQLR
ncbi:MAG: DUF1439 domain-containing protein [Comamonadaceae bacterium]|nr:MAG: DUF1439 domain-containing protein [Comamonadaceae bacterium]